MGKIAIWILIAVAVMLVLRLIGTAKRRVADDDAPPKDGGGSRRSGSTDDEQQRDPGELMMSCAVCGVHVPASDALFARGKVFCGPEHRDVDSSRREAGG